MITILLIGTFFLTIVANGNNLNATVNETTNEMEGVSRHSGLDETNLVLNQEDEEYMKAKMDALNFSDISVEVNYADNKEYEFEIDQEPNKPIEVEVDNELANVFLKGRAAFDVIYPNLEKLNVQSDTRETEIIENILTAFDLPTDYVKIEVEIRFNDGKKIDFEHRK